MNAPITTSSPCGSPLGRPSPLRASQTTLRFKSPTVLKPLVDLQAAAAMSGADASEEEILARIESAPNSPDHIGWAWNIASAASKQREIRILAIALDHQPSTINFDVALYKIFPTQMHPTLRHPTVSAAKVARRFGCTRPHINQLVREGSLQTAKAASPGRAGSPAILWDSIKHFLATRRITTASTK